MRSPRLEPRPRNASTLAGPAGTPLAPQPYSCRGEVRRDGRAELTDRHGDGVDPRDLEDTGSDRAGERLEQAVAALGHDCPGSLRPRASSRPSSRGRRWRGLTELGLDLEVDLERLRRVLLALEGSVVTEHPQPAQLDSIGHR